MISLEAAKNIITGWCEHETEEYIGLPKIEDIEIEDDYFCAYLDFGKHGAVRIKIVDINELTDFNDDFDIRHFGVRICMWEDIYEACNWWDTSIKFFWMKLGDKS